MSSKIEIKIIHCGNPKSDDGQEAEELKQKFVDYFAGTSATGKILILSNLLLYGRMNNELDIVVFGSIDNFEDTIFSAFKNKSGIVYGATKINVSIKDFCLIIEQKRNIVSDFKTDFINTQGIVVHYASTNSDDNVTAQSRGQMITLMSTLRSKITSEVPAIVNLILLKNVESAGCIGNTMNVNVLYRGYTIKDLWETSTQVSAKFMPELDYEDTLTGEKHCTLRASQCGSFSSVEKILTKLAKPPVVNGAITRKRLEMINTDVLKIKLKDLNYDKGVMVFKGNAGTGKTSSLLRIAYLLKEEKNARVIILSYNRALVADIRRTFAFLPREERPDGKAMQVGTMQHFFIEIMKMFGIADLPKFGNEFQNRYESSIAELNKLIASREDVDFLKMERPHDLAWDYVLVDEAQDWTDDEKSILLKLYGDKHVIIADGGNQIVRTGGTLQNWTADLSKDSFVVTKYKEGLRQMSNLNTFVKSYAEEIRQISWNVTQPSASIAGGKVEVFLTSDYKRNLDRNLTTLKNLLSSSQNELYDLLMFVPNSYVSNGQLSDATLLQTLQRTKTPYFEGVNASERNEYPLDQLRIFQYESCRGLEGWVTVCLDFDLFLENKKNGYVDEPSENVMNSLEDRKKEYIDSWIMMIITRPISQLIITISDPYGETANELRRLRDICPDYVELYF